jgi:exosome complex RNA-binding protein Rrp4
MARSGRFAQMGGGLAVKSKLNWDFAFAFSSSEPEIGYINITSSLLPEVDDKVVGSVEINTPWTKYEMDRIKIDTELK